MDTSRHKWFVLHAQYHTHLDRSRSTHLNATVKFTHESNHIRSIMKKNDNKYFCKQRSHTRMAHDGIVNGSCVRTQAGGASIFRRFVLLFASVSYSFSVVSTLYMPYYYISVYSFDEMKEKQEKEWNKKQSCTNH